MKKNLLLLFCFVLVSSLILAQGIDKPRYTIVTHRAGSYLGTIEIELFPSIAPLAVQNFDSIVQHQGYDSTAFHRVVPGFVIQGGDPNSIHGPISTWGQGNPNQANVPAEFSVVHHYRGRIGAARDVNINSANSQFYICAGSPLFLDGQYTVYGQVTNGMEVVDTIVSSPRDANDNPLQKIEMFITADGVNDTIPVAPTLITPANGTTNFFPSSPLQWSNVADAVKYIIDVSVDSTFATIDFTGESGDNARAFSGLHGSTLYYWRVKSDNGGHQSGYSTVFSFTTTLAAPSLISPPDSATNVYLNPVFQWSSASGADNYTLQVSTSNVFTGANIIFNQSGIMDTTLQVAGLNANTTYWWRTRSYSGAAAGLYSQKFSFTTGTSQSIKEVSSSFKAEVYPNPLKELLNIKTFIKQNGELNMSLMDMNGKIVFQKSIAAKPGTLNTGINTSALTEGVYFLKLEINGEELVRKVQVE